MPQLLDGIGSEQAGRLHLTPKPGQNLLVENGSRAAGQPLIDHKAHGIRTDVDDRNGRPVIETTLCEIHGGPTPLTSGRDGV